jgi:hypothetical protein
MLDQIQIASPCSADWERMEGDDRVRFCGECKKNVFNLSAMTRRDAEALLKETNGNICTRLFRRADGTVLTDDCSVGLRIKAARVRRRVGWAIAGALGFATTGFAQSAILSGIVKDATGATIASARITLTDSITGTSQDTKTDADGKFKIGSLSAGYYTVNAISPGFMQFQQTDVKLSATGESKLDVTLQVGSAGGPMFIEKPKWWRRIF